MTRKRGTLIDPVRTTVVIERDLTDFMDEKNLGYSETIDRALRSYLKFNLKKIDPTIQETAIKISEMSEQITLLENKRKGLEKIMEFLQKKVSDNTPLPEPDFDSRDAQNAQFKKDLGDLQ